MVGALVGKRMANQTGLRNAFNAKDKESSVSSFRGAYENSCRGSFASNFNDYASNPKLEVSIDGVVGETDNGIIEPGEAFSIGFTIRNFGGVGAPVAAI